MSKLQADAARASQSFSNSFGSIVSDFGEFQASLSDPVFTPSDLAFVETEKSRIIAESTTLLESMIAQLAALNG